tara:strand:- start:50505 stop:51344 length:840 start_codon:yes stop_codon:yes gene_type:complete
MIPSSISTFIPAHVSLFFSPFLSPDPLKSGSTGAGLTLSDGMTFTASSSQESVLSINGSQVTMDAATMIFNSIPSPIHVDAKTNLPLGSGFGLSGAVALGVASSAQSFFNLPISSKEIVQMAHSSDVSAGTGLGDVMSQSAAGAPIRIAPGGPGYGLLDTIPETARIEYLSFDSIDTSSILSGDLSKLQSIGSLSLESFLQKPSLDSLFDIGYKFATKTNFMTPAISEIINLVMDYGGKASMAMLGETVISLENGLSDAGYKPNICEIYSPPQPPFDIT